MASINIDTVVAEFAKWRSAKSGQEPIPERLWQLVKEIYHHYPSGLLRKRLGISSSQLRSKGLGKPIKPNKQSAKPVFVKADLPVIAHSTELPNLNNNLEVQRQDGAKFLLKQCDSNTLAVLLQQFLGQ